MRPSSPHPSCGRGVKSFAVPDWKPGDEIPLGGGNLRVAAVEWHDEEDEVAGR